MTEPSAILSLAATRSPKNSPVLRYAWIIAGISALVATIASWRVDIRLTLFGVIIVIGLTAVVISITALIRQVESSSVTKPGTSRPGASIMVAATTLVWAFTIMVILASSLLLSSFFLNWPMANLVKDAKPGEGDLPLEEARMIQSLNNSELDSASAAANEILTKNPDDLDALNTRGSVSFYNGDFEQAKRDFERYVSLQKNSSSTRSNLADTYVELGRYDDAIRTYNEMPVKDKDWQYELARAHIYNGDYQKGLSLLAPSTPV